MSPNHLALKSAVETSGLELKIARGEIDSLNAQLSGLRVQLSDKQSLERTHTRMIGDLQTQLEQIKDGDNDLAMKAKSRLEEHERLSHKQAEKCKDFEIELINLKVQMDALHADYLDSQKKLQ